MARVKPEVREAVEFAIADLEERDPNVIKTCGLCNRTLFDELVQIQVKTEARQKTVCDIFADFYNENRHEEDQVSGKAFSDRIDYIKRLNRRDLSSDSQELNDESRVEEMDLRSDSQVINSSDGIEHPDLQEDSQQTNPESKSNPPSIQLPEEITHYHPSVASTTPQNNDESGHKYSIDPKKPEMVIKWLIDGLQLNREAFVETINKGIANSEKSGQFDFLQIRHRLLELI